MRFFWKNKDSVSPGGLKVLAFEPWIQDMVKYTGAISFVMLQLGGLSVLPILTACSVNPATGEPSFTLFMSPSEEKSIGRQQHPLIIRKYGGAYSDAGVNQYVAGIGSRIMTVAPGAQPGPYHFTILDTMTPNAFALPGGYVYITRGLLFLLETEAQLAGVLAHEIGHVNARHTAERLSRSRLGDIGLTILSGVTGIPGLSTAGGLVANIATLSYSRDQEREADLLALRTLAASGYDLQGVPNGLRRLADHRDVLIRKKAPGRSEKALESDDEFSIFATHPGIGERVVTSGQIASSLPATGQRVGRREYLEAINGMVWGPSTRNGVLRERTWLHPDWEIGYNVPSTYHLKHRGRGQIANGPQDRFLVVDSVAVGQGLPDPEYHLTSYWGANEPLERVRPKKIDGSLTASTAIIRRAGRSRALDLHLAVVYEPRSGRYFRFLLKMPAGTLGDGQRDFDTILDSFQRLSPQELDRIRPFRLAVRRAGSDDRLDALIATSPLESKARPWLTLLNGERIEPGQWIKTIE